MAGPIFYQTTSQLGIDPTVYYTNLSTAGGTIVPEYPAPPFTPGTRAFGSDGSEFIFVQASTSISLTDFVVINSGNAVNPFMANSVTTTNVAGSFAIELASTGLVLKQSVTFIPAQAMFWACTKGDFIPATTSGGNLTSSATGQAIYTTATAGQVTSTGSATAGGFAGITVINSLTISIAASVVPQAGTLTSTGFTQGPVVSLNKVRTINFVASIPFTISTGGANALGIFW
jgi:hypothetical protein